jgi:hypothetical protein
VGVISEISAVKLKPGAHLKKKRGPEIACHLSPKAVTVNLF